jgi:4-hydroxy-tetrahydrodipicolinate synthase
MIFSMSIPEGVHAASLTPLDENLDIDHDALARHCRWLFDRGCDGVAVLGTTGEANAFSVDERLALMERLTSLPLDRMVAGTGCCALPDTLALTRRAVALGFAGVLVLPPFYYKRIDDDGLFAYFDRLVQDVGDDRLRICLYHFPKLTGVPFSHALIERLLDRYPRTVAGIKDSGGDVEHMKSLVRAFPGFQVFAGTERYLLEAGGAGCISATANLTSPLAARVHETRDPSLQDGLTALRAALESHAFIPSLKRIMREWTGDERWYHVRPPHVPMDRETACTLLRALEKLEHFTLIKP